MRLQLKRIIGVLMLPALAAMLVAAAVGAPAAGASEFKSASFPVTSLSEGLGISTFLSESLNSVTCQNSHGKGEVTSSTLAKAIDLYLTGCKLIVEKSSIGKFTDTCVPDITTKQLDIVPLSKLNLGTKTGVLILPITGAELASFRCGTEKKPNENEVEIKVKGSVICESTPIGSLVMISKIICAAGATHGSQEFTHGTNPQGKIVEAHLTAETTVFGIFKATEKDSQETNEIVKYSQLIEQTA